MTGETAGSGYFEGRRAAVTGAGGFIGAATCRALANAGASVRGIDVDADAAARVEDAGAEFAAADVTDPDAMARALGEIELVVHTAALVHEGLDMDQFVRVNV